MTQTFTVGNSDFERTVKQINEGNDEYIDVEITGKEGIDVISALEELHDASGDELFDADLPVEEMMNMARGGIKFPDDCFVLVPSQLHAEALMLALVRYEPKDSDFTPRLRKDFLTAFEETPELFDVNPLKEIHL